MKERVAVVGLGYVGLPVALAFAKRGFDAIGFDIDPVRIDQLKRGIDRTRETDREEVLSSKLRVTSNPQDLRDRTMFIVGVPTPVDTSKKPDLTILRSATETVGSALTPGAIVVYESTVYPGCTEEVCGPLLEQSSGLSRGKDFWLGYSPERINPGDREHSLQKIVKVVSGENEAAVDRIASAYASIIDAGVHRAPSIKVAEAAKVIENTQRDLNIALMNELAIIFDKMEIRTSDVLAAARTKWNFLPFTPGLVGGHCIGVDPFYLTYKADLLGYHPHVILAGRRINDGMGHYVAQRTVKLIANNGITVRNARVGVMGITFKENVPDLRNSRVPDIITELKEFGIEPLVSDPLVDSEESFDESGIRLLPMEDLENLDALIVAVPHSAFLSMGAESIVQRVRQGGVLFDVKSIIDPDVAARHCVYSSL